LGHDSSQLSYDEFHSARFAHQTGDTPESATLQEDDQESASSWTGQNFLDGLTKEALRARVLHSNDSIERFADYNLPGL